MRNWRKDAKGATIVLIAALVVSQAIRIDRSNPPVQAELSANAEVAAILRRACYNCHSNETLWPWYTNIAPVSWLAGSDVYSGRRLLNFSSWEAYDRNLQSEKLKEIAETVAGGEMPPWYYTLVHSEARLDAKEREQIKSWTTTLLARPARQ